MSLKNTKKQRGVIIYWRDVTGYNDNDLCKPSAMITEGILAKKTRYHIYVEKPVTIRIQGNYIQNYTGHHTKNPFYMCFPKTTIDSMEEVSLKGYKKHYEDKKKRSR